MVLFAMPWAAEGFSGGPLLSGIQQNKIEMIFPQGILHMDVIIIYFLAFQASRLPSSQASVTPSPAAANGPRGLIFGMRIYLDIVCHTCYEEISLVAIKISPIFPKFPSTLVPFSLIQNHISVSKSTLLAVTGPYGQLASSLFIKIMAKGYMKLQY